MVAFGKSDMNVVIVVDWLIQLVMSAAVCCSRGVGCDSVTRRCL